MNKEDPLNCPFCRIFDRGDPVSMVWEDDRVAVFVALRPVNPGNLLVVPKRHLPYFADLDEELAMHVMRVAQRMAAAIRASGLRCEGVNLFLADGEAAQQEVFHFHLHVYPRFGHDGFGFKYDPARNFVLGSRAEMDRVAQMIRAQIRDDTIASDRTQSIQTETRQSRAGSAAGSVNPPLSGGRKSLIEQRIAKLISQFSRYLEWYDVNVPFNRPEQLASHVRTIRRRLELGTAAAAIADPQFRVALRETLQNWGIGQRGSNLVSQLDFDRSLISAGPAIQKLDGVCIDAASLQVAEITDAIWNTVSSLHIVDNRAPLVPCTKALHHLLPDLIVPMDREYTRTFFGWHAPEFQGHGRIGGQRTVFERIFSELVRIARATNPASFVAPERPWRTSRTKILDNALVGFCLAENLEKPS